MMRWSSKPDANRAMVVAHLRAHGATWMDLTGAPGTPDGVVGYRGVDQLVEIKAAKGRVSEAQEERHRQWRGRPVAIVRTAQDATAVLDELRLAAEVLRRAAG